MTDVAPIPPDFDHEIETPHFSMAAFVGDNGDRGEVNLLVTQIVPDIRQHASVALLFGLAIMTLDQQGVINAEIDRLLSAGPISEVDAVNRIALLMQESQNVQPV